MSRRDEAPGVDIDNRAPCSPRSPTPNERAVSASEPLFLSPDEGALRAFEQALATAARVTSAAWRRKDSPTAGDSYHALARRLQKLEVSPLTGVGLEAALGDVEAFILPGMVTVGHARYAAHLHGVPAIPALAAEAIISATNQSLDSFDQAPSATAVERHLIAWLGEHFGWGPTADGAFTGGATKSNLMGIMLARDAHARRLGGHEVARDGLPPEAGRFRILCSELAHFSIERAAAILGLGERSVVRLPADDQGVLQPDAVRRSIEELRAAGQHPIALVLTAGTTDLGSIDRLAESARIARDHAVWTHVDAAAGGAYVFSDRLRDLLRGIERADSLAFDFHKLMFQPISCGVFLVRDADALAALRRSIPYLDPNDGAEELGPNLVGRSLDTTRRFDALKVLVTMRALGRTRIAELLEVSVTLARYTAEAVARSAHLQLLAQPMTNTVLFRWVPGKAPVDSDVVEGANRSLPQRLWKRGGPVIGGTTYRGQTCLKLTFTHPGCTETDVDEMLREVERAGDQLARELRANQLADRKPRSQLRIARVRAGDTTFAAALRDEFRLFGLVNQFASDKDIAAGRMLWYTRYDAHSEFYIATDPTDEVAGIVRLLRHDAAAGLASFSTLADARSYSAHGEPPRSYLDPQWEEHFERVSAASIAELATQAVAPRYRRFRAVDALWHHIYDACRGDGVEFLTMALVVPLFKFYASLWPNALSAIGSTMPDYIGADSVPAVLQLTHPEVEAYLRQRSPTYSSGGVR